MAKKIGNNILDFLSDTTMAAGLEWIKQSLK